MTSSKWCDAPKSFNVVQKILPKQILFSVMHEIGYKKLELRNIMGNREEIHQNRENIYESQKPWQFVIAFSN